MAQDDASGKIEELQALESQLQTFLAQKQAIQIELNEIDNALEELKNADGEVYKVTSGFLIKADDKSVKDELGEKKRLFGMRVEAMEKQEKLIEKDVAKLRDEINKIVIKGG
ncbi:MAG: prefoldin subunit [Nanoarchaeota archaeon]|nr:prefoldin subunit [Nanoarchaeota archaeon]